MTAANVITMSSVQIESVQWLWPNRLPLGKLVVFDGDPSMGKSTLTLDLAARVSNGSPWPDGTASVRGDVLLLSAEDGLADTIAPRLAAAGADQDHVHVLFQVPVNESDGARRVAPPSLPRDIPFMKSVIHQYEVRLVIVDVFMAFLSGEVDSHRDQDVRRVLHELSALAEEAGCTIILIRHLNKTAGSNAMYRGGGSIGIIGAARAAFLVARDPDDDDRRIFAILKSNLGPEPPALAYRLTDSPQYGCARVDWEATPVSFTASALLGAGGVEVKGGTAVDEWLLALLSEGAVRAADVYRQADAAGFSKDQVKRAKGRIKASVDKLGMTDGWAWSLPEERTKEVKGGQYEEPPSSLPSRLIALPSDESGTCNHNVPVGQQCARAGCNGTATSERSKMAKVRSRAALGLAPLTEMEAE